MKPILILLVLAACSATETKRDTDAFAFDGTCVNCHAGLSAGHVHANYKLRCIDCHGGNDTVEVPAEAHANESDYRNRTLIAQAHVTPKPELARFFYANGLDDDGDGAVDETVEINGNTVVDFGEVFEPGLHGQGAGEFFDTELSRDLNYTRFLNPGDLRVATLGCGGANGAANASGCHQQTIDIVRRSIMVNQSAVINGAYYGNESWRTEFQVARGDEPDPRAGAFGYTLDYAGADMCIRPPDANDPRGERATPRFDPACLQARAALQDPTVAAGAAGNIGLPAFEIAQGDLRPVVTDATTIVQTGAGDSRLPWGGHPRTGDVVDIMQPTPNGELAPGVPDPVDVILRTFRAYYPLNYPGSTVNFNFTFGTSILPEIARFRTANPYGRGHSSGCSACHAPYAYDGSRRPTRIRQDDGTIVEVVDPTTKHRELDPAKHDRGPIAGRDRLIGRAVSAQEQLDTGRAQQKTYSANHAMTTKIDTDTCGLCHGFVTRINLAYQGMAEEEQRDALARRKPIEFTTPAPASTQVRIVDSWVREDNISGQPVVVEPEGVQVVEKAIERDANLAAQGIIPGAGGCAQAVFSEDCNNNGELDTALVLTRVDEDGDVVATATIDEDQNGNGKLDLIDRIPRERAIDGRQMRYVYGGRNGSTRLMDVHFERGMHCIDCHFLQDVHGDGHIYSTNWDAIEIECEDCHGTDSQPATLVTSGPNGGNDLTRARNDDLQPFFERRGDTYIQRSRVTPGVFWRIPQTVASQSAYAREAHSPQHIAGLDANGRGLGSDLTSAGKLVTAKLDCHTCHSSWVHNCMGCHVDMNLGDPQRKHVDAAGNIVQSAAENEVWFSNNQNPAHVNFQLLGLLRSPFVLGVGSKAEAGRLMPFRSSMQVHLSVTGADGHTVQNDVTFTTFQNVDGNSGRMNVATSAVAMNQTMPHTVRPREARGCETCHALVDAQGRVRNEHVLAQTYGLGTGSYPFVGDWAIAAGTGGIELVEHKQEKELAANVAGKSNRFPGLIINSATRTAAAVEPLLDGGFAGGTAVDVVLIRNFNPTPALGQTTPPTLRDLAVFGIDAATDALVITDITGRGHPTSARASISTAARTTIVALPAAPTALAHLSPDVSDPFVYVAVGAAGVSVVEIRNAPGVAGAATLRTTVSIPGKVATDVALAGDLLYVGTAQGTIETFSLADPAAPVFRSSVNVGSPINDIAIAGFLMYVGTPGGVGALALDDPEAPSPPRGTGTTVQLVGNAPANGVAVREGKVYFAGSAGVFELDMRTPGGMIDRQAITGNALNNPVDLVISGTLPGQTWVLVLEANGDLVGIKLDTTQSTREKCFPNPKTQCKPLDMQLMDPTILGRDPSFDPVANQFDPVGVDPSAPPFFRITSTIVTSARRLARPAQWDTMGTLTGRRLRDSFMPGAGVLSLEVMQRMHAYEVCELEGQPSTNPSGLDALGTFQGGQCVPFTGQSARTLPACRPAFFGGPTVCTPPPARASPRR